MIKILLGGSPCTYWSIAQKNNRETEPSGMGWELFENYLIAKEKFQPDIFLYENNKSAAQPIKDEIKKRLRVWDGTLLMPDSGARYIEINSALVSAQNRQRFYVHNCGDVQQPKDRGILLRDILESGVVDREKAYCLKHQQGNTRDYFKKRHTQIAFEPIAINDENGKSRTLKAQYSKTSIANTTYTSTYGATMIAESIRIPEYSTEKSRPLTASYAHKGAGEGSLVSECFPENPNKQVFDYIAEPVRIGTIENNAKNGDYDSKQYRVYSPDGKSTTLCGQGGGVGAKTGLYACPTSKSSNTTPIYEVKDGKITIKGKQYPIKLADGYYIIRKLTVTECCRLQGMPDWWFLDKDGNKILSDTQSYKGLGNGWQLDTVKYILEHGLRNIPKDEEIILLSLYDGIGTGRRILEELGFAKVKYYAYEIDKYCIKLTSYRYPDIIHCGDAFKIRNKGEIEKII